MTPEQILEIQRASFKRLGEGRDHGVEERCEIDSGWTKWEPSSTCNWDGTADVVWSHPNYEYRIRPDTVNVFGMEFPPATMKDIAEYQSGNWSVSFVVDNADTATAWEIFFHDCLSGKYAIPKLPDPFREHPKNGQMYWYIESTGDVRNDKWSSHNVDIKKFNAGNCYRTESDAKPWADYEAAIRKGGLRPVVGEYPAYANGHYSVSGERDMAEAAYRASQRRAG